MYPLFFYVVIVFGKNHKIRSHPSIFYYLSINLFCKIAKKNLTEA